VLSTEAKTTLDDIASKAMNAKGYVLEVSGFADSRGSINLNRQLSQRRADAVIRYLVENHSIPLRRIITPFGYGEMNPVAENETRDDCSNADNEPGHFGQLTSLWNSTLKCNSAGQSRHQRVVDHAATKAVR
jgi:outer membrane protein OmpA-like peptidoglycan-associated protein